MRPCQVITLFCLFFLVGCPFENQNSVTIEPLTLQGAAVKAPIVNANVNVYALDLAKQNLKGELLISGVTTDEAQFDGIILPSSDVPFLLEIEVTEDSVDLMVGTQPLVKKMRSFILPTRNGTFSSLPKSVASPLTDMVVEIVIRFADKNTEYFNGNEDGIVTEEEWKDALVIAQHLVKSVMGYGLIDNVDLLRDLPLFDEKNENDPQLILNHRLAIETASTLISDLNANAFDEVSAELAQDLADGELDGQQTLKNTTSTHYRAADISRFSDNIKSQSITKQSNLPKLSELKQHIKNEVDHINQRKGKDIRLNMNSLSMPFRLAQNRKADHDGDGFLNVLDEDDDNDGILDKVEHEKGTHHLFKPEEVLMHYINDKTHPDFILSSHDYEQLGINGVNDVNVEDINAHVEDLNLMGKAKQDITDTLNSYVKITNYFTDPNVKKPDEEDYQRTGMQYISGESTDRLNEFADKNEKKNWRQISALSKLLSDNEIVSADELNDLGIQLPNNLPINRFKGWIKKHGGKKLANLRTYSKQIQSVDIDNKTDSEIYSITPNVDAIYHQGFPSLISKENNQRYGASRVQRNNFFKVSPLNPNIYASAGNMIGALLLKQENPFFTPIFLPNGQSGTDIAFSKSDENNIVALMFNNDDVFSDNALAEDFPFGIYTSHDKGDTWKLAHPVANNKKEPTGNNMVIWGENALADWVFVATHDNGVLVSTDAGHTFTNLLTLYASNLTNDQNFSSKKFIRTLAISSAISPIQYLYVIANDKYTIQKSSGGGNNTKSITAPDGDLFVFTIENNEITKVSKSPLYKTSSGQTSFQYADIAIKTNSAEGFALIRDKPDANLEGVGGKIIARIYDNGEKICDQQNTSDACSPYTNLPESTEDKHEICNVLNNPFSPNMWVMLRGGETKESVLVSLDDGKTWQYETRNTTVWADDEYVIDFEYSSNMLDDSAYNDILTPNKKHLLLNSEHGCQGPSISFIDADSFVIIPISKEKPAFITQDKGATFTSFSLDSENKWLMESALAGDYQLLAFGEYGYMYTVDGGASYRSLTDVNNQVIREVKKEIDDLGIVTVHGKLARGQNVVIKENEKGFTAFALYSIAGYLLKFEYDKTTDTIDIERIKAKPSDQQITLSFTKDGKGKINYNSASEGIWINDYIYFGNLISRDGGISFTHLCENSCSNREDWYMVLAAHPHNPEKIVAVRGKHTAYDIDLFVSSDAGITWDALPDTNLKETVDNKTFAVRSFRYFGDIKRGITFDPLVGKDNDSYRLLLAGRSGIYLFTKDEFDTPSQLSWALQDKGFKPIQASNTNKPWLTEVITSPTDHALIIAAQGNDKFVFGQWLTNANLVKHEFKYQPTTTHQPLYISYDSGETWFNLIHPSLPDYLTFTELNFNQNGDLYIYTSNYGFYIIRRHELTMLNND